MEYFMKNIIMTATMLLTFSQAFAAEEVELKPKCVITEITVGHSHAPTTRVQLEVQKIFKSKGYTIELTNDVLDVEASAYEIHFETSRLYFGNWPFADEYHGVGEIKDLKTGVIFTTSLDAREYDYAEEKFEVKLAKKFPVCGSLK
jgi:hypothetical protein